MVIWDIFSHFWAVATGFIFTASDSFYAFHLNRPV
jgi:hypothetical protein